MKNISFNFDINNFDLTRLILSVIVFLVHSYNLTKSQDLIFFVNVLSSNLAVKSFFIISGFLIFMSFENSNSTKNYFLKRIRRIYPAYFFIVVFFALIGYFLSSYSFVNYFSLEWIKYVFFNLIYLNFMAPNLPGVFEGNLIQAVNGALWTLKIEVLFYLSVPLIVWLSLKFGRIKIFSILYFLSCLYIYLLNLFHVPHADELIRQLPGQISYFLSGGVIFYYFDYFKQRAYWLLGLSLIAFIFIEGGGFFKFIEPLPLAIIVIYFSCIFKYLGNFAKYGDFSYGIYILHFPILQILVQGGLFISNPYLAFCLASSLAFFGAFLLWHLVEKRFLKKSSHYLAKMK
jgi:peptidoglycan/LPS O-acetylase OafA/YrhL